MLTRLSGELASPTTDQTLAPTTNRDIVTDLAAVLGVNKNTVICTMYILRDEGLVEFGGDAGFRLTHT